MLKLPLEVILHVVDQLATCPGPTPVALPSTHLVTRTLLALNLPCRAVRPLASRLLYTHCLYIDSHRRLGRLLQALKDVTDSWKLPVPICPQFPHGIQSLFLAPFDKGTIDDYVTAKWVEDLLYILSPHLKRLVIDIPLRSLYPDEDHLSVRPILRNAFLRLTNLEEFTSARDELYLNVHENGRWANAATREDEVWTLWPKLKRLALYNPDMSSLAMEMEVGNHGRGLPQLQTLVVTRADGLSFPLPPFFRRDDDTQTLKIMVANMAAYHQPIEMGLGDTWSDGAGTVLPVPRTEHYAGKITVVKVTVPADASSPDYEDPIETCQEWMRDRAIEGSLWSCEGEVLKGRDTETIQQLEAAAETALPRH